ncbi:ATP-binding protein [Streptomyces alfalfae]|uniref:ATP-binding protein n=1 Tax=Streptomyces alfalfae TaxID=1642299 RepID=A0A4Q7EV12_9ACTN|nr:MULTISPECIES: ATP-binding protein [Streptomyces]AYA21026.1 ATP-binding protein [Streptomyces fradiae]QQC92039.1 ATP-binding protein [Streptomyces alfalfae]QUI34559.1 ATP-binding protein [Streptomyces alfalfae]RXX39726.1 ATP-binding protein [Streptomyces alfalfae]RZM94044.1 ATP-binding protein [Streptomyces alfalfae]
MTRQTRGGAPGGLGNPSPNEAGREACAVPAVPATAQLRRRLAKADLRAVSEVRGALREFLRQWGRPGAADVAELLTSELVTNALVHTDDDAVVTASVGPRGLRVEVRDFAGNRPEPRAPDPDDSTHGRGLVLVQSLADAWGVRAHGVGKAVWFELGGGSAA